MGKKLMAFNPFFWNSETENNLGNGCLHIKKQEIVFYQIGLYLYNYEPTLPFLMIAFILYVILKI